ncbi:MAG: Hint domain-containing protein [Paracoccus sp. (in: a-proteobacteria)]
MAFISELHYKDSYNPSVPGNPAGSATSTEYAEIALNASEAANAGDYVISFYNYDGTLMDEYPLSAVTPDIDPATGLYIYRFNYLLSDPDSVGGSAEAVALTHNGTVLQFYDIGGGTADIVAQGGAAAGSTSTNIPAAPGNNTIQIDNQGNVTYGPATPGMALCLTAGTMVATPNGNRPVESLRVGEQVLTRDHGPQRIRWIGGRRFSPAQLAAAPHLAPIRIAAGAISKNSPGSDLAVSPQHRILFRSVAAIRLFATEEVLVAAKHLLKLNGIEVMDSSSGVTYFHIALDRHQIIFANGAEVETLYPGPEALKSVSEAARDELLTIFPDCEIAAPTPARPMLTGKEARSLTRHHA